MRYELSIDIEKIVSVQHEPAQPFSVGNIDNPDIGIIIKQYLSAGATAMPGLLDESIKIAKEWARTREPEAKGFHDFFYTLLPKQYSHQDTVIDEWVHKGWVQKYPSIPQGTEPSFDVMHMTDDGMAVFRMLNATKGLELYSEQLAAKTVKKWLEMVEATTLPRNTSPEGLSAHLKDAPVFPLHRQLLNDLEEGLTGVVAKSNDTARKVYIIIVDEWKAKKYLVIDGDNLIPTPTGIAYFRQQRAA